MARPSISTPELAILYTRLLFKAIRLAGRFTRNPLNIIAAVRQLIRFQADYPSFRPSRKTVRINGTYYWHLNVPGYPSAAFDRVYMYRIARLAGRHEDEGLCIGILSVTNACPLDCEHCYESEWLQQADEPSDQTVLSSAEHLLTLKPGLIFFSGGEPATRLPLLLNILQDTDHPDTRFWMNTSGAGLDAASLERLKDAGMDGIIFSIDHFNEEEHDRFRGRKGCWKHAVSLIRTAQQLQIPTALSLCATNRFTTLENLCTYMRFAANLNVTFVHLIDAKPVGRYRDAERLQPEKVAVLESFHSYCRSNRNLPILCYPDRERRNHGCSGGRSFLYVDAAGQAFPCPFCRNHPVALSGLSRLDYRDQLSCPVA